MNPFCIRLLSEVGAEVVDVVVGEGDEENRVLLGHPPHGGVAEEEEAGRKLEV